MEHTDRLAGEQLLKTAVNDPGAHFRPGQWEAIDTIVNQRRKLLVVERTGWGKSSVYFISTRLLRDLGAGPTIIVSPLLALMRNQVEAAKRLGIRAETVNSTNQDDWQEIEQAIRGNLVDALLISPERLSNEEFVGEVLRPLVQNVGLFVVDEAHCISDWGHDFRPDYRRLVNVLRQMPPNMPVLGTTATANNRVIHDVQALLGDMRIQRGPLVRKSLSLQTLRLTDQASRLAWLAQRIPELPGTGIVYALTTRDTEQVADWLNQNGIEARAYHASVTSGNASDSNLYRQQLEELLLGNRIKVLVATTALGMGYDKPDLGFVIHYQAPSSVVAYYQQVGRAGRAIESAYGAILAGGEDDEIHEYFRTSSFPKENDIEAILEMLAERDEQSISQLEQSLNLRRGEIASALKFLSVESPAPVIKEGAKWRRTPVLYRMDKERIEHLTSQRELEWNEIQSYIDSKTCLMTFLRNALDDPDSEDCGRCSICLGHPIIGSEVDQHLEIAAAKYLRRTEIAFKPRLSVIGDSFPIYGFRGYLNKLGLAASEGRILSRWGDAGWGRLVADAKAAGQVSDTLIQAAAEMIQERWQPDPRPEWVTCVPSFRNPDFVPDFAQSLAIELGLPFVRAIRKLAENEPQKHQQNRFHQCNNLDGKFEIAAKVPSSPVLLVDDIIDSGWTITVLAALLRQAGSGEVYPTALASTSSRN